jgi:hypothetical protein
MCFLLQKNSKGIAHTLGTASVVCVTHQGREYFQVYGTEEVYSVSLSLVDMRGDTVEQTPSGGDSELNWSVPTGWCSCPTFTAAVVIATEQLMVSQLLLPWYCHR